MGARAKIAIHFSRPSPMTLPGDHGQTRTWSKICPIRRSACQSADGNIASSSSGWNAVPTAPPSLCHVKAPRSGVRQEKETIGRRQDLGCFGTGTSRAGKQLSARSARNGRPSDMTNGHLGRSNRLKSRGSLASQAAVKKNAVAVERVRNHLAEFTWPRRLGRG